MEQAIHIVLVFHFIGLGALLSGFFYQLKSLKSGMTVNAGIIHGAWLMFVTGMGMAGMTDPAKLNTLVIAAKAMVLTAIFFLAYMYKKKEKTPAWVVPAIAGLTVLNIVLAVVVGVEE